jgi:hypothetical protein
MSGGHFDYKQYDIQDIADDVIRDAISKDCPYSKETKDKFMVAYYQLVIAKTYLNRIDWLLSGDDGEDTFHERLKADLAKLEGEAD